MLVLELRKGVVLVFSCRRVVLVYDRCTRPLCDLHVHLIHVSLVTYMQVHTLCTLVRSFCALTCYERAIYNLEQKASY